MVEEHTTLFPLFHYGRDPDSSLFVLPGYYRRVTHDGRHAPVAVLLARARRATARRRSRPPARSCRSGGTTATATSACTPGRSRRSSTRPTARPDTTGSTPLAGRFETYGAVAHVWVFPTLTLNTNDRTAGRTTFTRSSTSAAATTRRTRSSRRSSGTSRPDGPHDHRLPRLLALRRRAGRLGHAGRRQHALHAEARRGGHDWQFHLVPLFSYGEDPHGYFWNVLFGLAGYSHDGTELADARPLDSHSTSAAPRRVERTAAGSYGTSGAGQATRPKHARGGREGALRRRLVGRLFAEREAHARTSRPRRRPSRRAPATAPPSRRCTRSRRTRPRPRGRAPRRARARVQPGNATFDTCGARGARRAVDARAGGDAQADLPRARRAAARERQPPGRRDQRCRAATASPAAATGSTVPGRRPRSWLPPRSTGASGRPGARDERADRLRAADLVRREAPRVGLVGHVVAAPERLHRVDVHARARRDAPSPIASRDRLDDARLGVHRLQRDQRARRLSRGRARDPRGRATPSGQHAQPPHPRAPLALEGLRDARDRGVLEAARREHAAAPLSRPRTRPENALRSARLFASVPPDVRTTSRGSHRASFATASRAVLDARPGHAPDACTLDGLPHASRAASAMASTTSASGGVVAFQSR